MAYLLLFLLMKANKMITNNFFLSDILFRELKLGSVF